jgi:SPP1 gp7 family putative phage head morphogenesis protein
MAYDLRLVARQAGVRRDTTLRPIEITNALKRSLFAVTVQPVRAWQQEISDRILPAYGQAVSTLTRDDETDDLREVIRIAEALIEGRTVQVDVEIEAWMRRAINWHDQRWAEAVRAGTGVDVFPFINQAASLPKVKAFQQRISSLIRDINATARKDIEETVWRGLTEQTPRKEMGKEIAERLGIQRRRANRIAIDQAQKLSGKLTEIRMNEAGLTQYEWRHSGKVHYRPEHKARNGKKYALGYPRGDTPGLKPFCGCIQLPIIDVEE